MSDHRQTAGTGLLSPAFPCRAFQFLGLPNFQILSENNRMKQNINSVFMGKPGTARFLFCALLLMFCLPFVSQAQDTGSITGTVRDVSGSVVPGADVQVSSAAIGLTRAIATNGDGDYLAGALPAGT